MAVVRMPSYFPQRVSTRVNKMQYVDNIEGEAMKVIDLFAPNALNDTFLLTAASMAAAADFVTFTGEQSEKNMNRWGRSVSLTASGVTSAVVTVRGRDHLGVLMREDVTLNGTTRVETLKAFRFVDRITVPLVAATTLNVGIGNRLGIAYKLLRMEVELKDKQLSANAGTFTPGLPTPTTPTATNADVRGTYLPVTVVPNGVVTFEIRGYVDKENIHGNKHFFA